MKQKKILIVDDEESITNVFKLLIERTGKYEVRTETKGAKALAAAKKFKPDLILLDIMMPDLDGGEVAAQIKEDSETFDIPIVFVSAAITKQEAEEKEKIHGGYPMLAKPVSLDELMSAVEKYSEDSSSSEKQNTPPLQTGGKDQIFREKRSNRKIKTINPLSYDCMDRSNTRIAHGMGKALNISQGGILMETPHLIETEYILISTSGIRDKLIKIKGQVIYSKKVGSERYHTGIKFLVLDENIRTFVVELIKIFNLNKDEQLAHIAE